jgi:hypothetical protein
MRSVLFWDITQRRVVTLYRRFGTTYRSHLQRRHNQVMTIHELGTCAVRVTKMNAVDI